MGDASLRIGYFSDVILFFAFHRDRRTGRGGGKGDEGGNGCQKCGRQ
jgi:hypothetical protein